MLCRDPDDRFSSARDVASALQPYCEAADLASLLRKGIAAEEKDEDHVSLPVRSATAQSLGQTDAAQPDAELDTGKSRAMRWLTSLAAGFLFILLGTAFYIATNHGTVVLKSDDPDARVSIRRGSQEVDRLQVSQNDGRTQVRTGAYVVELVGESAGLTLLDDAIDVSRGQEVEIRIVRDQQTSPIEATAAAAETLFPKSSERFYEDRTYKQWMHELRYQTEPLNLQKAVTALSIMGTEERAAETANQLFALMNWHGLRATKLPDSAPRERRERLKLVDLVEAAVVSNRC